MEKKNGSEFDRRVNIMTEIENLQELIDREEASMSILLSSASGHDQIENDDIVMLTRDSLDRVEKMEESLNRLEKLTLKKERRIYEKEKMDDGSGIRGNHKEE